MAKQASGVEAGVLAGDKSTRIFIRILIPLRSCGAGEGFSTSSRCCFNNIRFRVLHFYHQTVFGSEEGACRFVMAHVFSSHHPPSLLTHQFSRTLTFSSKDAVGRSPSRRAACCTILFALPRGGPRIPFFFGGHFQMEISAEIETFFDFRSF